MRYFHFLFIVYAVITLEGLRPSIKRSNVVPSAETAGIYSSSSTHQNHVDAHSNDPENPIANQAGILNTTFQVIHFAISRHHCWIELAATVALRGAYFYSHSGLSPPQIF